MASIKETFSKGITTLNVKTNNFMEQNKIKTYISNLEKEIVELHKQSGQMLYEHWKLGDFDISMVEELLKAVSEKYDEIQAQNKKLEQILLEEQQILGSAPRQAEGADGGITYCSQCGAQNESTYKFCRKCGSPLK